MQILLDKVKINLPSLRRLAHKITSQELSKLVEACYYPELKKYYYEFLNACHISEKDTKEFTKRFWQGRPESKWMLHNDPIVMFYIFISHIFLKEKDLLAYNSMMTLIGIRNYTNLMHKQMQYCNEKFFRLALERLTKTHLFSREKTIPNAIHFLSKEMQKKYTKSITAGSKDDIAKFITEYRHRISQSVKTFAEIYYKTSKEGASIKEPYEGDEDTEQFQQLERNTVVVDRIVKKIAIYKEIDKKAMNDARSLTKISSSLATLVVNEVTNIKYSENIRLILELFLKDLKSTKSLCGPQYIQYVRSLMATRRMTDERITFKQQINELLLKILSELKYIDKYEKLTRQTQFLVNLYLAYYITMVMKNTIC